MCGDDSCIESFLKPAQYREIAALHGEGVFDGDIDANLVMQIVYRVSRLRIPALSDSD